MKLKNISLSLKIGFAVILTTIVGLFYVGFHFSASSFWPAAGLIVAVYIIYEKKALVGIIVGTFITIIAFRIFMSNEPIINSFVITLISLLGNVITVLIFSYLTKKFEVNLKRLDRLVNGISFSYIAIIAAGLGAFVSTFGLSLFYGFDGYFSGVFRWFIGDFIGILVFGSLVLHSYYRDSELDKSFKNLSKSVSYMVIYVLVTYLIFAKAGNDFISFENFQIALFIMYMITAFVFSYRMILFNNLVFLIIVALFHIHTVPEAQLTSEIVLTSIYLLTLSSISSMVKNILYERNNSFKDLGTARDNLEKIILSTNNLFNIQDKLPEEAREFKHQYLVDMFDLACRIYPKFDKATCNIAQEKYVSFVGAKNYELQDLNNLRFLSSEFVWTLNEPKIVKETDYDVVFENPENIQRFIKKYGKIKESIRFTVFYGEKEYAGMSFDIFEGNEQSFNKYDLANFKSFQHLMNSYYKVGILNTQKNNLKDGLVLSLVRTLGLYDSYTGVHSEEVANLSVEIAKRLKLSNREIRHIYWSSIVHDIGKIGLDNSIINKPGRLTDEEYELIKQHPVSGYKVLSKIEELHEVAKTVRHHHEWWNGSGYPDGIKGINIPFSSQILHVCDAVSAMAKDRVYKKALTEEEITVQLENGLGTQFSPKVAKFMINLIREGNLHDYLDVE